MRSSITFSHFAFSTSIQPIFLCRVCNSWTNPLSSKVSRVIIWCHDNFEVKTFTILRRQISNLVRNIFFSISFSTENERNIHTQHYKLRFYFYEMGNIFHIAITQSHSEWLTHLQLNAFIIFVETEWGKRSSTKML